MKVSDRELLKDLATNLENLEDPKDYLNISDLADKYNMAKVSIRERLKRLEERGEIKLSKIKSDMKKSRILNNSKIYIPTSRGLQNYGISRPELGQSSEGSKETSLELQNTHNLEIKFKVLELPETPVVDWDNREDPVELNNGVKQYIKRDTNEDGERITLILTRGKDNHSIKIKPKLLAREETVEDLNKEIDKIAQEYRRELERRGYKLGLGQKNDSEVKYTIRSPALEDLGYIEGGNFTIDRSEDVGEYHPDTGSERGNRVVAKALDGSTLEELEDKDPLEILEETGELGELFTEIEKNRKIQKQTIQGIKEIAQQQGRLAQSFNDLLEEIKGPSERIDRGNAPGGMYG